MSLNSFEPKPVGRLRRPGRGLTLRESILFGILSALMFVTTLMLKILPNIHLLALLIITITRVYRGKALLPIYGYVLTEGVYQGFSAWWVPYLYLWTVLWGVTMLLPRKMSPRVSAVVFCLVGGLHGLLFGTLWAPYHALLYGLSFKSTLVWIAAGIPFDITHGISNTVCCILAVPLINLLTRLERKSSRSQSRKTI